MTNLLRQAMPWVDRLVPFFDEGDEGCGGGPQRD